MKKGKIINNLSIEFKSNRNRKVMLKSENKSETLKTIYKSELYSVIKTFPHRSIRP